MKVLTMPLEAICVICGTLEQEAKSLPKIW